MVRLGFLTCIFFFCTSFVLAQSKEYLNQQTNLSLTDSAKISMTVDLALRLKNSGNMAESMSLFQKARQKAQRLENSHLIQYVNASLAETYLTADKPDSAALILQQTLEQFPHSERRFELLNLLGTAFRYRSKYQKALQTYSEAKALVDSTKNPRNLAVINQNMAVAYASLGNKGAALKAYLNGVRYGETQKDSVFLATVLNNLGMLYNYYSESEKAGFYLEQSMNISKQTGFKVGALRAASNLANTKKDLGKFDEALSLYQYALTLHKKIRPGQPPYRIIHNLGNMQLMKGNLRQAEQHFNISLKHSKELNIPQGFYYNYTGLAEVAEVRGDLGTSIQYMNRAFSVAEEIGVKLFQKTASHKLYQLHKKRGNFEEALSWHEAYTVIADSMQLQKAEQQLLETEALLGLRKQEQINQLLQQEQEGQAARIATQNWLIAAGLAIIILILISLILLYKSREEKQRINRELQQMNRVKDKILAIIAHDLRSPLSSMQGMLYLLREDDLNADDIEMMTTQLELSIAQNISMVDNLLAWAREQMSGLAMNIEAVEAREVVENTFENLSFQAQQKGITLINDVAEGFKVKADYNLLKLILRNLIANSIKFSQNGDSITVNTKLKNGKVIFEVNDTGIGIPEEEQRKLFSYQGTSREGTNKEKGSGLGLQLCKEFVEKQQGEILVKSKEGQGTTFSFSLPQAS